MPSAELCTLTTMTAPAVPAKQPDMDALVLEIKENLRLSGPSMKAIPCSHLSRKSSRASPYRIPGKYFYDSCDATCVRQKNKQQDLSQQDPYELLQTLLRSGNLVNEAVRRVKLGLTQGLSTKKLFYESDEESSRSPVFRFFQEN
ncbi:uncharacterized protein LOC115882405 [Sitophilus oryzae]|uniref:Uncharacterized protein LOC115882405 n=1 Tax=Sitophilus oryzae TaxID=7048 RepID=A0A6J2Y064_SITOR|nr:uncharacterized protein LOC115882405 [Sitophilus oryzae]